MILSIYEYVDVDARSIEADPQSIHDPDVTDFVKRPIKRDDQDTPTVGNASAGRRVTWKVNLVHRWALFPLHSGDLTIGPMSMMLVRPASVAGPRASEELVVHVSEPPVAGRPPGYSVGDVGRFSLTAQVKPREADEGGAVGVHVELTGTGNVPSALATPSRPGVEWLTPETHDDVGPKSNGDFGGKRTFDYVVRMTRAGSVDLGELALPFWNPDAKKYEIARAALGVVRVAPSAGQGASAADVPSETLPGLPAARDVLSAAGGPRSHLDDSAWFWLAGLCAWPVAFAAAVTGRTIGRRVRAAWRTRATSPVTELRERLAAARTACDEADARVADAAIARALEAATIAHAGVSVRGAVGVEVADRLERAGIAREAASRVADLLRECEAARFAPEAADIAASRDRWQRARGVIRGLEATG